MQVSNEKKHEYFNHFVAQAYLGTPCRFPTGVTGPRLRKIKEGLWNDRDFWWDIVLRHGGDACTPEQMERDDPGQYEHCLGNFWGQVGQMVGERGRIR